MLVLSRKVGESLMIGENIEIRVAKIHGNRIALAIKAPDELRVFRSELPRLPPQQSPQPKKRD